MVFSEKLLIGETVTEVKNTIDMLKNKIAIFDLYIIFINEDSNNLMDIIKSTELFKPYYLQKQIKIIAIANGRKEAFQIVKNIIGTNLDVIDNVKKFKEVYK